MRLFLLSLAVLDISAQTKLQSGIQKRGRRDNSILGFCNSYCKPTLAAVQEATCKKTTAIAVKTAIEKEAGLCKKTIAQAFNKTMAMEAKSCKKSIADAVNVEKEKEAAWCKKNSVMVEKVGPFKPSKINKIGDITKYYHNYEISMDLRFSELELQRGGTQLLVVSTTSSIDSTNSLLYLYPVLDSNNIFVHFYTGKSFGTYVKLEHKSIVFLKWHKDCFEISYKLIIILFKRKF